MFKLQTHRDVCSYLVHTNHPLIASYLFDYHSAYRCTDNGTYTGPQIFWYSNLFTYLLHGAESFLRS